MSKWIGNYTRRREARLALRFEGAPPSVPSPQEHQAMLDRILARQAALQGWPDGKPPPWPGRKEVG